MSNGPSGKSIREILTKVRTFSFKKMLLKCRLWNGGHCVLGRRWVKFGVWSALQNVPSYKSDNLLCVYIGCSSWWSNAINCLATCAMGGGHLLFYVFYRKLAQNNLTIIWSNAGILLIRPLGTNFSEILIGVFHSGKWSWKWRLLNGVHLSRRQWVKW